MHQHNWSGCVIASVFFILSSLISQAQYGTYGLDETPADTAAVDDIIYYGDFMDMSGGYQIGDTVYDFTAYDFDGNPVTLYTELSGLKPVVLVSGSVSCIRFRNVFDPNLPAQETFSARDFIYSHLDDYNWIFIYGVEAHPTDGNCPSNCPPTVNTDTAVVQPSIYAERRWAMHGWENSPEHDFPFTMFADNPDNAIYNNFFQRPFGLIALNCDGTVGLRADWVTNYLADPANVQAMLDFKDAYTQCSIDWAPSDDTDDTEDDGDEPVDYDGPMSGLHGGGVDHVANSIETAWASNGMVYPNPAADQLVLSGFAHVMSWTLYDAQGRQAASWSGNTTYASVDVSALTRGAYVLMGTTDSGVSERIRILLQ